MGSTSPESTRRSTPPNGTDAFGGEGLVEVDEAFERERRARNRKLLIVLLALALLGLLASYPLFNNFHDPYLSDTIISH